MGRKDLLEWYPFPEIINKQCKRYDVKRKLIKERGKRCERCGWQLPLTLHHIDHNQFNNEDENLKLYCRACHDIVDYGKVTPNGFSIDSNCRNKP